MKSNNKQQYRNSKGRFNRLHIKSGAPAQRRQKWLKSVTNIRKEAVNKTNYVRKQDL
jgi:hypothetical protein